MNNPYIYSFRSPVHESHIIPAGPSGHTFVFPPFSQSCFGCAASWEQWEECLRFSQRPHPHGSFLWERFMTSALQRQTRVWPTHVTQTVAQTLHSMKLFTDDLSSGRWSGSLVRLRSKVIRNIQSAAIINYSTRTVSPSMVPHISRMLNKCFFK